MPSDNGILTVYYDGACPRCVRERRRYQKLAGARSGRTRWVDITGRENLLRERGIDPELALRELHVEDSEGRIHRELDAYRLLMKRTFWLWPLGWLIALPGVRPAVAKWYHWWVTRRLRRTGRIPGENRNESRGKEADIKRKPGK